MQTHFSQLFFFIDVTELSHHKNLYRYIFLANSYISYRFIFRYINLMDFKIHSLGLTRIIYLKYIYTLNFNLIYFIFTI